MASSTMLALPPLTIDSTQWRLPLCDATAMELAQILAEPSATQRTARFAAVLFVDPSLAIWARLCAATCGSNDPTRQMLDRIPPLAQWLAVESLTQSDLWTAVRAGSFTADAANQFAALVAESVSMAREATRGFPHDFAVMQPLYLGVLTAQWRMWLQLANPQQPVAESMGEIAKLPSGVVGGLAPSTEARQTADEAWRRWLTEIPGVQALLPLLAAQAKRLHQVQPNLAADLQTAKLDAMKEFAYGAGHELNNPLANIASRAQTLLADEKDPERRRRLAAINTQAFRAHEMLADMMLFARPPQPKFEQVDIIKLADEVLKELADEAAAHTTKLERLGAAEPLVIEADPMQLRVALRALCINSLEAIGSGGSVTIEVKGSGLRGQGSEEKHRISTSPLHLFTSSPVQISVSDTGPGIAPEIRDKIFDPFFSGREAGRGLGFGLSKCWRIVTLHGGTIDVESPSPSGATFAITLPAEQNTNRR
jgi:signal transduction histidine kinase